MSFGMGLGILLLLIGGPVPARADGLPGISGFPTYMKALSKQTMLRIASASLMASDGKPELAAQTLAEGMAKDAEKTTIPVFDQNFAALVAAILYREAAFDAAEAFLRKNIPDVDEDMIKIFKKKSLIEAKGFLPKKSQYIVDNAIWQLIIVCQPDQKDLHSHESYYRLALLACATQLIGSSRDDLSINAFDTLQGMTEDRQQAIAIMMLEASSRGKTNLSRVNALLDKASEMAADLDAKLPIVTGVALMRASVMALPENAGVYTHEERVTQYSHAWSALDPKADKKNSRVRKLANAIFAEASVSHDFTQYDSLVVPYRGNSNSVAYDVESFDPSQLLGSPKEGEKKTVDIVIRFSLDETGAVTTATIEKCSDKTVSRDALLKQFLATRYQPRIAEGRRKAEEGSRLEATVTIEKNARRTKIDKKLDWKHG
jgi:hypothetical protein